MRKGRAIKSAVTASAMCLLVAACSTSATSGGGTGTITMWARDSDQTFVSQLVDGFNQSQKDVQVKLTIIPAANFVQKFGAAAATGSAPDVAAIDLVYLPYFSSKNTLADLTERSKELTYMDKLSPAHLRLATYQDKLYALPFSAEASVLYYNKDLFKKAGLDPSTAPKTYAEIKTAALKIRALGPDYYGYYFAGSSGGGYAFTCVPYIWAAGGDLLEGEGANEKAIIDSSPGVRDGLTFFKDLWDSGVVPASAKTDTGANALVAFQSGKVGMFGSGAFAVSTLKNMDFGVAPLPGKTAGQNSSFAGGDEIAIPSGSKNKDAAWKFLKYVTDTEAQTALGKLGPVPVRTDVATGVYAKQSPYNLIFGQQMAAGKTPYTTHYNDLINSNNGPLVTMFQQAVFAGDLDGALTKGQQQFTEILNKKQ